MTRLTWLCLFLAACGGDPDGGDDGVDLVGECDPPEGAADLAAPYAELFEPSCLVDASVDGLRVVSTEAEWAALFDCPQDVPAGIDLATQRAAVIGVHCSPLSFRFGAADANEIVVGIQTHVSGACIQDLLVVGVPRDTRPVRVATCQETCVQCPPSARTP